MDVAESMRSSIPVVGSPGEVRDAGGGGPTGAMEKVKLSATPVPLTYPLRGTDPGREHALASAPSDPLVPNSAPYARALRVLAATRACLALLAADSLWAS